MTATHRAPKQWPLTRSETINSFENWKQNLAYTLKLDPAFANFFVQGTKWGKRSKKVPHRGFTNDSEQTVGKQTPLSVVRVDSAPGFRALIDDPMLRKYRIQVEVGRKKNPNHNPVAEKAIQELESELVRQIAHTDIVTARILVVVTARLNTRIQNNGMSALEMWFQRDQYTNKQLPIDDFKRICEQHSQREQNHVYSERSNVHGQQHKHIKK